MIFAQFLKPIAAGLGITTVALGIVCTVQCTTIKARGEMIDGLRTKLEAETTVAKNCATEMAKLRTDVDEANAERDRLKLEGEASADAQAEADRLARRLAAAESRLAAIAAERDYFEARLSTLPRCEKYLVTLLALAGGAT